MVLRVLISTSQMLYRVPLDLNLFSLDWGNGFLRGSPDSLHFSQPITPGIQVLIMTHHCCCCPCHLPEVLCIKCPLLPLPQFSYSILVFPTYTWGVIFLFLRRCFYTTYLGFFITNDLPVLPHSVICSVIWISTGTRGHWSYTVDYNAVLHHLFWCSPFSRFNHREIFLLDSSILWAYPHHLFLES